jgi:hypothetical protein
MSRRSKPRTERSQRMKLPKQENYLYMTMRDISIVDVLRKKRFTNGAKRRKHASLQARDFDFPIRSRVYSRSYGLQVGLGASHSAVIVLRFVLRSARLGTPKGTPKVTSLRPKLLTGPMQKGHAGYPKRNPEGVASTYGRLSACRLPNF